MEKRQKSTPFHPFLNLNPNLLLFQPTPLTPHHSRPPQNPLNPSTTVHKTSHQANLNCPVNQNLNLNPIIMTHKLAHQKLSHRYNCTPQKYNHYIVEYLLHNCNSHLVSVFKDHMINDYIDEFLKRPYNKKEIIERIPKFAKFYKNYLLFFCKPIIKEMELNSIVKKYGEEKAEEYYKKNFPNDKISSSTSNFEDDDEENEVSKKIVEETIFTKTLKDNIDNMSILTSNTYCNNGENVSNIMCNNSNIYFNKCCKKDCNEFKNNINDYTITLRAENDVIESVNGGCFTTKNGQCKNRGKENEIIRKESNENTVIDLMCEMDKKRAGGKKYNSCNKNKGGNKGIRIRNNGNNEMNRNNGRKVNNLNTKEIKQLINQLSINTTAANAKKSIQTIIKKGLLSCTNLNNILPNSTSDNYKSAQNLNIASTGSKDKDKKTKKQNKQIIPKSNSKYNSNIKSRNEHTSSNNINTQKNSNVNSNFKTVDFNLNDPNSNSKIPLTKTQNIDNIFSKISITKFKNLNNINIDIKKEINEICAKKRQNINNINYNLSNANNSNNNNSSSKTKISLNNNSNSNYTNINNTNNSTNNLLIKTKKNNSVQRKINFNPIKPKEKIKKSTSNIKLITSSTNTFSPNNINLNNCSTNKANSNNKKQLSAMAFSLFSEIGEKNISNSKSINKNGQNSNTNYIKQSTNNIINRPTNINININNQININTNNEHSSNNVNTNYNLYNHSHSKNCILSPKQINEKINNKIKKNENITMNIKNNINQLTRNYSNNYNNFFVNSNSVATIRNNHSHQKQYSHQIPKQQIPQRVITSYHHKNINSITSLILKNKKVNVNRSKSKSGKEKN